MTLISSSRPELVAHLTHQRPPVPFIVGVDRSGTTLLRLMLDAHPQLAIPPETFFVPEVLRGCPTAPRPAEYFVAKATGERRWPDFHLDPQVLRRRLEDITPFDVGEAVRTFYRLYAERCGKPRFGDKTPGYREWMGLIQKALPEARFLHIIRDGRDVALSLKPTWWGPKTATELALGWAAQIEQARAQGAGVAYYLELRYEDLLREPEATLRKVCAFIDLPWDPAVLNYHERAEERLAELTDQRLPDGRLISGDQRRGLHTLTRTPPDTSRSGRWKTEMSEADRRQFDSVAGDMLEQLGYERAFPAGQPQAAASASAGSGHGERRLLFSSYHCYVDPSSGAAQSARDLLPMLVARGWRCRVLSGPHLDFEDCRPFRQLLGDPNFRAGMGPFTRDRPCAGAAVPCSFVDFAQGDIPITVFDAPGTQPFKPPARPEGYVFLAQLEQTLEEFRPDLLLTYGGHWLATEIFAAARRRGIPVVFWLHNCFYHSPDMFRPMAGVIVPSRFAQEHYRAKLGLEFTALPPPLDWGGRVCPEVKGKFVTFVNPQPDKGVFVFAGIVQELHRRRPDIPFLVVEGRGKLAWLRETGLDLDRLGNVHGMPTVTDPRLFYRVSRAVLMPSLWDETFGRVGAEALANGIPVLASRRGGLPEVLAEAGFLFDVPAGYTPKTRVVPTAAEVARWVDTIVRLWEDGAFYEEQRRRCLAAAELWKPDRLGARYDQYLTEVLERRRQKGPLAAPPGPESTVKAPPPIQAATEGPTISVIMPVHNAAAFLERALRSLQAQTFKGWELVAVDDGSTDQSHEILSAYAAQDPRIRPFRLPENRGVSAARNEALRQARGQMIAYLDSDDEYYPDYLAHVFAHRAEGAVLMSGYDLIEERPGSPNFGKTSTYDPGPHRDRLLNKRENMITPLGVAHPRGLLDRTGLFDEGLHYEEDWDLWKRFVDAGAPFRFTGLRSGVYHVRSDSQARTRRKPDAPRKEAAKPGPVFILGGGARTGSTLLQRLLLSTKQVLVWGEHRGVLVEQLQRILEGMHGWLSWEAKGHLERFLTSGYNAWIPNLNPEQSAFQDGCRQLLERALGQPARQRGYPRWGCKEVRYGRAAALFLQELFPGACFLLSVRDPKDCLRSIKAAGWYGPDYGGDPATFLADWTRLTGELVQAQAELRRALLVRYEDLTADPEQAIQSIARVTDIPVQLFDRAVFQHREAGTSLPPQPLDEADRRALADPAVGGVADKLGYGPDEVLPLPPQEVAAPVEPPPAAPPAAAAGRARRLLFSSYHCFLDPSSGAAHSARDLLPFLAGRGWHCRVFSGSQLDFEDGHTFAQLLQEPAFRSRLGSVNVRPCQGMPVPCSLVQLTHAGIPVTVFDTPGTRPYQVPTPPENVAFVALFEQALKEFRPDVVITYGSYPASAACMALAKRYGAAVVFWLRNCSYNDAGLFREVDGILVPTRFPQEFYRRRLGIDCTPIPSPIDWARIRCPEVQGKYVTFVNPEPTKGVFVFAAIVQELHKRRPDIPFLVVEGRGKVGWLKNAGLDLDKLGNVYGMAHTPEPRAFYRVSRVLLVPSLWDETFARVAAEATINGIPVLASRRGGLPEVLARAGFLFDVPAAYTPQSRAVPTAAEVAPWVDTIVRLWEDEAFYDRERRRCLAAAEEWKPDRLAARYDEFLTNVLTHSEAWQREVSLAARPSSEQVEKEAAPAAAANLSAQA